MNNNETTKTVKFTVKKECTLNFEQLSELICDGLTSIAYWGEISTATFERKEYIEAKEKYKDDCWDEIVAHMLWDGFFVSIYDIEEDKFYKITLYDIIKGITKNEEERSFDSFYNDYDGDTVDCILQYAIFDEVVYG